VQVYEIAKATGRDNKQVAADLGLDAGDGPVHLKKVEDTAAAAYIAEHGGGSIVSTEGKQDGVVRYWSATSAGHRIPADENDERGDIVLRGHIAKVSAGSAEDKFLRANRNYFIAQRLYRVIEKPFDDVDMRSDLQDGLRRVIFTGINEDARTPSMAGRDCVKALLNAEKNAKMDASERNNPKKLIRAVSSSVSLDVDSLEQGV